MSPAVGMYKLLRRFEPARRRLANHEMYGALRTVDDMRTFMRFHSFAVWDFMSLLKALQRAVNGADRAWRPLGTATARRLVNEIILEEESDEIDGKATSHFELYVRAMREAGADTGPIERLLGLLADSLPLPAALQGCGAPAGCIDFVTTTFALIDSGKAHVVAAAFTFGREDAIPGMFNSLVAAILDRGTALGMFEKYLARHIALDGDSHGPKAVQMLAELCGDDPHKWDEAAEAAVVAVEARLAFWDAIMADLTAAADDVMPPTETLVAAA